MQEVMAAAGRKRAATAHIAALVGMLNCTYFPMSPSPSMTPAAKSHASQMGKHTWCSCSLEVSMEACLAIISLAEPWPELNQTQGPDPEPHS